MTLSELKTYEFTELLASDAPAPGGGSSAALEGAIGAALTAMVCTLTIPKKAFADHAAELEEIRDQAERIRVRFVDVMNRDTEAFMLVSNAYSMPKLTDADKAARSAAIQAGLEACTATPFEMMELAAETIELAASLPGRFNETAASDLGVAAISLRSAVQGAWLNVRINIGSLKNKELAESYRTRGEVLLEKVQTMADQLYNTILALV